MTETKNYRRDYVCSGCGQVGIKLWRDYNTCADATELKCAECATPGQVAYEAGGRTGGMESTLDDDGLFTFRDGDQLGGMVPAVPTEEGDTFWGYSSVPSEGVLWWLALPTYRDPAKEIRALRSLLARHARSEMHAQKSWLEAIDQVRHLEWVAERQVYRVTEPLTITIWGSKSVALEGGGYLRYGEEMPHVLQPGDRVATTRMSGLVVLRGDGTCKQSPSVMDFEQDQDKFLQTHHQVLDLVRG